MPATAHHFSLTLRVSRVQAPVTNLGPGRRIALWVQGCDLGCPGCISPAMQTPTGGVAVDVRALAESLAAGPDSIDGLTISGGEPFQQYLALMALCTYYKLLCQRSILVYTGFRLAELERRHPDLAFAHALDYLIDGRYLRRRHEGGWRGSANQCLYRFVAGHAQPCQPNWPTTEKALILSVPDARSATLVGIPRRGHLQSLGKTLRAVGLRTRLT